MKGAVVGRCHVSDILTTDVLAFTKSHFAVWWCIQYQCSGSRGEAPRGLFARFHNLLRRRGIDSLGGLYPQIQHFKIVSSKCYSIFNRISGLTNTVLYGSGMTGFQL